MVWNAYSDANSSRAPRRVTIDDEDQLDTKMAAAEKLDSTKSSTADADDGILDFLNVSIEPRFPTRTFTDNPIVSGPYGDRAVGDRAVLAFRAVDLRKKKKKKKTSTKRNRGGGGGGGSKTKANMALFAGDDADEEDEVDASLLDETDDEDETVQFAERQCENLYDASPRNLNCLQVVRRGDIGCSNLSTCIIWRLIMAEQEYRRTN